MPEVVVFDVNETLLDLAALDPHFERAFGDAAVRRQCFAQVLQSDLVAALIGSYRDFGAIGAAAHDWDVAGAMQVGWSAALVARPVMVLSARSRRPDIVGRDLREVVDQILGG